MSMTDGLGSRLARRRKCLSGSLLDAKRALAPIEQRIHLPNSQCTSGLLLLPLDIVTRHADPK